MEVVSACDPLNLVGIVTPGERVSSQPGNRVVFRDGVPTASLEKGVVVNRSNADAAAMTAAADLLYGPILPSRPEQRPPFDTHQGSIESGWLLPEQPEPESATAVGFNLD